MCVSLHMALLRSQLSHCEPFVKWLRPSPQQTELPCLTDSSCAATAWFVYSGRILDILMYLDTDILDILDISLRRGGFL